MWWSAWRFWLRGDVIEAAAVPVEIRLNKAPARAVNLRETRESAEREHILRALRNPNGTSPARPARWAWNGPICTNASGRWASKGSVDAGFSGTALSGSPHEKAASLREAALLISKSRSSRSYGRFTFSAWRPLGPLFTSNSTSVPSSKVR